MRIITNAAPKTMRLAQRSRDAGVVRAHYELAAAYLDRIYPPQADDQAQARASIPVVG